MSEPISPMEHFERVLKEYKEGQAAVMAERDKALVARETALALQIEHLNALRGDVVKDRILFLQVAVYEVQHKELERRLMDLEQKASRLIGLGVLSTVVGIIIGAMIGRMLK